MRPWLLYLIHIYVIASVNTKEKRQANECELRCHSSFTATEREQLCRGTHKGNLIGPALCASEAKSQLSVKFETISQLCKGASSIHPVTCYHSLPSSDRSKYGIQLCARADSNLVGRCWGELSKLSGAGKLKDGELIEFCQSIDDEAPMRCVKASVSSSLTSIASALDPCRNASLSDDGMSFVSDCLHDMKKLFTPTKAFSAVEMINFCTHAGSNGSVRCFEESSKGLLTPPVSMAAADRARLCLGANGTGPVECALETGRSELRLRPDAIVSLCSGADGGGPARCFRDAKNLGAEAFKLELCNAATTSGPSLCVRRALTAFKGDNRRLLQLCVRAASEDPGLCVHSTPYYLSPDEKITLCQSAQPGRGQEPLKCLQLVEGPSHHFKNAPTKGLGYSLESLSSRSDRISRELLVNMCSFEFSQAPILGMKYTLTLNFVAQAHRIIAAAECLKTSSFALNHDDAVR